MWQLFLAISILLSAFATIFQRFILSKKIINTIGFAVYFQVITGLFIGIFALIPGFVLPNLQPLLFNLLLAILIYAGANVCLFKALSLIEASDFTILFVTRGVWTIFGAIIFLRETFSFNQTIGTVLIIISVILVFFHKHTVKFNRGSFYALAAAFFFGVGYVNDAFLVSHFSKPLVFSFLDFILPAIFLVLIYRKVLPETTKTFAKKKIVFLQLLAFSFMYAFLGITSILAYTFGGKADQIGAIMQTGTIVTVLLAVMLLKERDNIIRKLIATAIAFIGVLLLR